MQNKKLETRILPENAGSDQAPNSGKLPESKTASPNRADRPGARPDGPGMVESAGTQVVIAGCGRYPKTLPQAFAEALEQEIAVHLKGYGILDATVKVLSTDPEDEKFCIPGALAQADLKMMDALQVVRPRLWQYIRTAGKAIIAQWESAGKQVPLTGTLPNDWKREKAED